MPGVGEKLKAAREARKMSVDDVAAATRIRTDYIRAMDDGQFHRLPASIYARGFVKIYAECVGLDAVELLKLLRFDAAPPREPRIVSRRPTPVPVKPPVAPPARAALVDAPRQRHWRPDLFRKIRAGLSRCWPAQAIRLRIQGAQALWLRLFALGCTAILRRSVWLRRIVAALPAPVVRKQTLLVAGVVLLVLAAGLTWYYSAQNIPALTSAMRWVQEPPDAYLDGDVAPQAFAR